MRRCVPQVIVELVMEGAVIFSGKVRRALLDGDFSVSDLESCVCEGYLSGNPRRDELRQAEDGKKYVIHGRAVGGRPFYVVGKITRDSDGLVFFFITAHERDE